MTQVTWRAPDELVERVRAAATEDGRSLNDYLTQLARAATDPEFAADDTERLRERLARAGLLARTGPPVRHRPDPAVVAEARRAAGEGVHLSELVAQDRG